MFIVHASQKNRLKPHRGGMGLPGAADAAPMGLGRIRGRGVATNLSPRRGWAEASARADWPNQSVEPTGGSRFCQSAFVSQWRLPPVAHAHRWSRESARLFLCT